MESTVGELDGYIDEGIELARKGRIRSGETPIREGIRVVVAEIASNLHGSAKPSVSHLVHYTGMDVLFSMLDGGSSLGGVVVGEVEPGKREDPPVGDPGEDEEDEAGDGEEEGGLRLYDTVHANDPEEGRFLLLNWPEREGERPWMWKERGSLAEETDSEMGLKEQVEQGLYPGHAYVVSFIPMTDDRRNDDRIVFWREYGREGAGCSLSIQADKLLSERKCLLTPYRVKYGRGSVEELEEALREHVFGPIEARVRDATGEASELFDAAQHQVRLELQLFRYLYKDSAYDYEEEYRLVILDSAEEMVRAASYERKTNSRNQTVFRHYMRHPSLYSRQLFGSGSHITLGPTISHGDNVETMIKELLRRNGISGTTISPSEIRYRGR